MSSVNCICLCVAMCVWVKNQFVKTACWLNLGATPFITSLVKVRFKEKREKRREDVAALADTDH